MSSAFTANVQLSTHQKAQDTEREGHTEGDRENLEWSARARSPERRRDSRASAATDGRPSLSRPTTGSRCTWNSVRLSLLHSVTVYLDVCAHDDIYYRISSF